MNRVAPLFQETVDALFKLKLAIYESHIDDRIVCLQQGPGGKPFSTNQFHAL